MPYDSVDPASLSGDALDRWYRRIPDEIEVERQAAAQARYDNFFRRDLPPDQVQDGLPQRPDRVHLAAAQSTSLPSLGEHAANCPTCHGRVPLPPPSALPFPWSFGAYFRDGSGGGSSPRDPKQCDIQLERDHEICGGLQPKSAKRVCRDRASTRYDHCLRTREVDSPIPLLW